MASIHRTGTAMYVSAIAGFIALMAWLFSGELDERRNPNQEVTRIAAGEGDPPFQQRAHSFGRACAQRSRDRDRLVDPLLAGGSAVEQGEHERADDGRVARRRGVEPAEHGHAVVSAP